MRPVNLPRSASSHGVAKIVDTPTLNVEEGDSRFPLNSVANNKNGINKKDPSSFSKSSRQSSDSPSSSGASGGLNDILTGLLNVVGEGLSIATNYVREENKRKKASQVMQTYLPGIYIYIYIYIYI